MTVSPEGPRYLVLGLAALVPPSLFFCYQVIRELAGDLQAPIELVGNGPIGILTLAVVAAGLPAVSSMLGLLAARERPSRRAGIALTIAAVLLVFANIAARDS